MNKYLKIITFIFLLLFTSLIVYATVTVASTRKSPKLPWQWVETWFYNSAHNVWISNVPESRFTCNSWTCNSSQTNTWVVYDSITKLYWQSWNPASTYLWSDADTYCNNLVLWWFSDWRLPNIKELLSILDYSRSNPIINTTYFSSNTNHFWSSTSWNPTYYFYVEFIYGSFQQMYVSGTYYSARCTRG